MSLPQICDYHHLKHWTPKIINFPFVPNGKFIIFRHPKIWAYYSLIIMCLDIGTLDIHHFPFGTNGKVVVLGVPILKGRFLEFRRYHDSANLFSKLSESTFSQRNK